MKVLKVVRLTETVRKFPVLYDKSGTNETCVGRSGQGSKP